MNKQFSTLKLVSCRRFLTMLVLFSLNQGVFAADENIDFSQCATYTVTKHLGNLPHGGPFTIGPITTLNPGGGTIAITAITVSGVGTLPTPYSSPIVLDIPSALTTGITFTFNSTQLTISCNIPSTYKAIGKTITFTLRATNPNDNTTCDRTYDFVIDASGTKAGDPHITTVDGVHYNLQSAGEFVALRDSGGSFEIQARQTAVATSGAGFDSYDSLTTCVSLITAVAARVGTHRVTYQPNINGEPDPSGMQLWVDDKLTELGENGIDLGSGGRVVKSSAGPGVIEIDFPDGASLVVTPGWWSYYSVWYLNIDVYHTTATKGIMGVMADNNTTPGIRTSGGMPARSWLPALPDGSSLGPMPGSLDDRFVQLYTTFADAWRVTNKTSLFHYKQGDSTDTFTNKNWPAKNSQLCSIPNQTPQPPIDRAVAEQLSSAIVDPNMRANAIFDVMVTGDSGFAKTYLLTQRLQIGTTATTVNVSKDTTMYGDSVTLTATVFRKFSAQKDVLTGSVEFTVDGEKVGHVKLEADGRAVITTTSLKVGRHQIAAMFIPDSGSTVFSSSSPAITHTVIGSTPILHQWWFWLLMVIILLIIIWLVTRKSNP